MAWTLAIGRVMVLMLGNNQIPRTDGTLKWHALTAMRYQMLGSLPLTANHDAIRNACTRILHEIWQPPKDSSKYFNNAIQLVKSIPRISEQELRTKPFTDKLIAAALAEFRASHPKAKFKFPKLKPEAKAKK